VKEDWKGDLEKADQGSIDAGIAGDGTEAEMLIGQGSGPEIKGVSSEIEMVRQRETWLIENMQQIVEVSKSEIVEETHSLNGASAQGLIRTVQLNEEILSEKASLGGVTEEWSEIEIEGQKGERLVKPISIEEVVEADKSLVGEARIRIEATVASEGIETLVSKVYGNKDAKRTEVEMRLDSFLRGEDEPSIVRAKISAELIKGMYLEGEKLIVIADDIERHEELLRVVIEELGHWLDDTNTGDSGGDEGKRLMNEIMNLSGMEVKQPQEEGTRIVEYKDRLLTAELSYTEEIDKPIRIDKGVGRLVIIEDSGLQPLGLQDVDWAPRAQIDRATGVLTAVEGEGGVDLEVVITEVPDNELGVVYRERREGEVGNLIELSVADIISIEELKRLAFEVNQNAHGETRLKYQVKTIGLAQEVVSEEEVFGISVLAVNDKPRDEQKIVVPVNITEIKAEGESSINLGLADLREIDSGDNRDRQIGSDQEEQVVTFMVSEIPEPQIGMVMSANRQIELGDSLSLEDLKNLRLVISDSINVETIVSRSARVRVEAIDTGSIHSGGPQSAAIDITVAFVSEPAFTVVAEQAVELFEETQEGKPIYLNPDRTSKLEKDAELYLAEIGGKGEVDGEAINYVSNSLPFFFDIDTSLLGENTYTHGGVEPTHELRYKTTLSGQFRSSRDVRYEANENNETGFQLDEAGRWSIDLDKDVYQNMDEARVHQVSIREIDIESGEEEVLEIEIEIMKGLNAVVGKINGRDRNRTTVDRGMWLESNEGGRDKDHYFKYINEYTLSSYGAVKIGEDDVGDSIFSWNGSANTADGNPLTLLNGELVTKTGYYDFTRRNGEGDGVEFIYERIAERDPQTGEEVEKDYIVGMRFYIRDNMYGDNMVAEGKIRDPGSSIRRMRELGKVVVMPDELDTLEVRYKLTDSGREKSGGSTVSADIWLENNSKIVDGEDPLVLSWGDDDESETTIRTEKQELRNKGTVSEAPLASVLEELKEIYESLSIEIDEDDEQRRDEKQDAKEPAVRRKGLRFELSGDGNQESNDRAGLLESLLYDEFLGINLLDGLALGLGMAYIAYGPKSGKILKREIRSWLEAKSHRARVRVVVFIWVENKNKREFMSAELIDEKLLAIAKSSVVEDLDKDRERGSAKIQAVLAKTESHLRDGHVFMDQETLDTIERDSSTMECLKGVSINVFRDGRYMDVLKRLSEPEREHLKESLKQGKELNDQRLAGELDKARVQYTGLIGRRRAEIIGRLELLIGLTNSEDV